MVRDGAFAPPHHEGQIPWPHPEEHALRRASRRMATTPHPRGLIHPGSAKSSSLHKEGAGNAGRTNAPAASCVERKTHECSHRRLAGNIPAFPARMVLRLIPCSLRRSGFLVTVISEMRQHRRQLRASVEALRPHGFVVRATRIRLMRCRVHRIPRPTFVTIGQTPSCEGAGRREEVPVICPTG